MCKFSFRNSRIFYYIELFIYTFFVHSAKWVNCVAFFFTCSHRNLVIIMNALNLIPLNNCLFVCLFCFALHLLEFRIEFNFTKAQRNVRNGFKWFVFFFCILNTSHLFVRSFIHYIFEFIHLDAVTSNLYQCTNGKYSYFFVKNKECNLNVGI